MEKEEGEKFFISFSLYSGCSNGQIVIWTPLAKEKTRILRQHYGRIDSLSFSPDGRFLASAGRHGKLIIWSTEVNKKTEPIKMVWYLVVIQYWMYSTLFQNWEPVYIGEGNIRLCDRFSWFFSSTDVPDYKLPFYSYDGNKVSTRITIFVFLKAHYNNHAPRPPPRSIFIFL